MRRMAALVVIASCAVAFGQPASEAGRGIDFHFSGPAPEAFSALEAALGIGRVSPYLKQRWGALGDKPVLVDKKGARLFDIICALEKQIGQRLGFYNYWMRPTLRVSTAAGRLASSPRAETPDCDLVLEKVERSVTRQMIWGPGGPVPGPADIALNLKLRVYPIDPQAAERLIGFKRGSLVLVHPDGKQDPLPYSTLSGSPPLGRLLKEESFAVPGANLAPGEYTLKGMVTIAKVDPLRSPLLTAADVGRKLDLGPFKLTIRDWGAAHRVVRWELDKAVGQWGDDDPSGPQREWLDMMGRGPKGEIIALGGASTVWDGPRSERADRWVDDVTSVEFRAMMIRKPKDVMEEPFEIRFDLPEAFAGQ